MSHPPDPDMADMEERIIKEHQRRFEDRDKLIHNRLDGIEKEYKTLTETGNKLNSTVTVVQLEQGHLKELFTARLSLIEESNKLQTSKLDQIGRDIFNMSSEVDRTPMGRQISNKINAVAASLDETNDRQAKHEETLKRITAWQDQVNGVLAILKWLGVGGLVALGLSILRLLKLLPS